MAGQRMETFYSASTLQFEWGGSAESFCVSCSKWTPWGEYGHQNSGEHKRKLAWWQTCDKRDKVLWAIDRIKVKVERRCPNALSQFMAWCTEEDPEASAIAKFRAWSTEEDPEASAIAKEHDGGTPGFGGVAHAHVNPPGLTDVVPWSSSANMSSASSSGAGVCTACAHLQEKIQTLEAKVESLQEDVLMMKKSLTYFKESMKESAGSHSSKSSVAWLSQSRSAMLEPGL